MRIIKKISFICAILVALSIAGLLLLFYIFTNTHRIKTQIAEQIYLQTGLQVELNGKIGWVFVPQLGMHFDSVVVKQPLAFDAQSLAKSRQVEVWVGWRAFISGQVKIQKLIVHQLLLYSVKGFSLGSVGTALRGDMEINLANQQISMDHFILDSGKIHVVGSLTGRNIFHSPEFNGQLEIPRLNLNKLNLTKFTGKFSLNSSSLQIRTIHATVAGGTVTGQIEVSHFMQSPHYQIQAALSHAELSQLLQSGILQGYADISFNLTMIGNTQAMMLSSLNGTVKLASYNGIFNHFDLLKQVSAVHQFLQTNLQLPTAGNQTHFSQLTASGIVKDGLFINEDFSLNSPHLRATGEGTVNLVNQQIKYRLWVKMEDNMSDNAYALSVPLKIGGTLAKPKIKIDLGAINISVESDNYSDIAKQLSKTTHNELKILFERRS